MANDPGAFDPLASGNKPPSAFNKTIKPSDGSPAADEGIAPSLARFFTLPRELQLRIVELACCAPTHSSQTGPFDLDAFGALDLLSLSRYFHDLVAPILLAHIRVTSSSALLSLHKALLAKPERGRLIRSLHLGPCNALPESHWPLIVYEDVYEEELEVREALYMVTSLDQTGGRQRCSSGYIDEELAPRWQECRWEVSLGKAQRGDGCRGRAVYAALVAAMTALDVDPDRSSWGKSGRRIGLAAWCKRIFDLRAALDLYLIAMRRLEDCRGGYDFPHWRQNSTAPASSECQAGTCAHRYPKLVLDKDGTSHPQVASQVSPNTFYLSPRQIAQHLARPHSTAMTNRFDHPLIFARTGYPVPDSHIGHEGQEKVRELLLGKGLRDYFGFGSDEEVDYKGHNLGPHEGELAAVQAQGQDTAHTGPQTHGDAAQYLREIARPRDASEEVLPSTETLGGLLALARTVICQAPNVSNLSLTGIFHRLLCSRQVPVGSDTLRCLSIGPVLPYWTKTFTSKAMQRFPNLERLRVCVPTLTQEEIGLLAGEGLGLTRLESVRWETMDPDDPTTTSDASLQNFVDLYLRLKGAARKSAAPSLPDTSHTVGKRKRDRSPDNEPAASSGHNEPQRQPAPPAPKRCRSINVLAPPRAVHGVLETAPSEFLQPAKEEEDQLSIERGKEARQRLRISESAVPQTLLDDPCSEAIVNHLYASSQRWWEESAFYCGFRGWES